MAVAVRGAVQTGDKVLDDVANGGRHRGESAASVVVESGVDNDSKRRNLRTYREWMEVD